MVAGLISGLAGGFLPSELRTGYVLEISCLHLLLHFSGKAVSRAADSIFGVESVYFLRLEADQSLGGLDTRFGKAGPASAQAIRKQYLVWIRLRAGITSTGSCTA